MSYVEFWARAFALTLVVELAVAPRLLPGSEPGWRRLGAVALANVASHPAVWFVFPELIRPFLLMLLVAELWAFGSEVLVYRLVFPGLAWRRAVVTSALANGASLGVGLVLRALGLPV